MKAKQFYFKLKKNYHGAKAGSVFVSDYAFKDPSGRVVREGYFPNEHDLPDSWNIPDSLLTTINKDKEGLKLQTDLQTKLETLYRRGVVVKKAVINGKDTFYVDAKWLNKHFNNYIF